MIIATTTNRKLRVPRRPALLALAAALAGLVGGCSDDPDEGLDAGARSAVEIPARPPYVLTADVMDRFLTCLAELRDERRRQAQALLGDAPLPPLPTGVGITLAVEGAERITRAHGFARTEDFEQALAHVQQALAVQLLYQEQALGTQALRHRFRSDIHDLERQRAQVETDATLSREERSNRLIEIDRAIAHLETSVADVADVAASIESQRDFIPEANATLVSQHRDRLLELLRP
jgi:hypothetical protein